MPSRCLPPRRFPADVLCIAAFVLTVAAAVLLSRQPVVAGQRAVAGQPAPGPALRFRHGGNAAEIPMEIASNAIFVPVQMNQGQPSDWLLDTASARTAADPAVSAAAAQAAPALSLPGLAILGLNPAAQAFQSLGPWYGIRVGGVLGDDVLTRVVAELDYSRRSIELYDPRSYRTPPHLQKFDIHWESDLPAIRAKLRLGGRTLDGDFLVNTAASGGVLVSREFLAAKRGRGAPGQTIPGTVFAAGGERAVTLTRAEWLDLGPVRVAQPIVAIDSGQPGMEAGGAGKQGSRVVAGWIGGGILRKFIVVLDFPADRLLLAPNRDFICPIEADASGATIVAAGPSLDGFQVASVTSGSPAADAGLLPGDRIVVIDSEPASDLTLDQVRDLFSGRGPGPCEIRTADTVALSILRSGHRARVELHLKKLL